MAEHATDHVGLEVLDYDECLRLLAERPVGRIAFVDAGQPVILPVNHAVDGRTIVFRSATGTKVEHALHRAQVAFEVDDWDELYRTGWSVLVRGHAEEIIEPDELEAVQKLPIRPYANQVEATSWVRIIADEVTGRRIR